MPAARSALSALLVSASSAPSTRGELICDVVDDLVARGVQATVSAGTTHRCRSLPTASPFNSSGVDGDCVGVSTSAQLWIWHRLSD